MSSNALCSTITASLGAAALALAGPAFAQTLPAPLGVVGLTASASTEVTKDLLNVTLTTTREGEDAAAVQAQLKQALDAALAEARKAARPGQVEEIRQSSLGQDVFISPGDVGRFFAATVEAKPWGGFRVVYASSRHTHQMRYDLGPAERLLGFVPQDRWPDGAEEM